MSLGTVNATSWSATLCPPLWANGRCLKAPVSAALLHFERSIFPTALFTALRLYQSVFRFEWDVVRGTGADRIVGITHQIEHVRLLGCFLRHRSCWSVRPPTRSWSVGVRRLCHGARGNGPYTNWQGDATYAGLQQLCVDLLNWGRIGGRRGISEVAIVKGLGSAALLLAAAALPIGELTAAAGPAAEASSSALAHLGAYDSLRRIVNLLEHVANFANSFPAELRTLRLDLLSPSSLSPGGICKASDVLSQQFPPPEHRWFRPALDGTRFYSSAPSVLALLGELETRGAKLTRWTLNLGAGDGRCEPGDEYDPANCLVELHGWRGVLIEGDASLAQAARERFAGHLHVEVLDVMISP